jgi:nitrogen regulatory protein P-II 1
MIACLITIEAIVPEQNDIRSISDALKKIDVGGITVLRVKGRGKRVAPKIHAGKGTELFTPEFSDKYILQVVISNNKQKDVVETIRSNSQIGKIFIIPLAGAIDIETGVENDQAI